NLPAECESPARASSIAAGRMSRMPLLAKPDQQRTDHGHHGGNDAQQAQGLAEKYDANQGRKQDARLAQGRYESDRRHGHGPDGDAIADSGKRTAGQHEWPTLDKVRE